ncbi:MAG: tagaturonate epimerase family protein [Planctomycetes bacterium]|nr:tagaturonate epimerase family protein [Planctomycetota bacterium]
MNASDFFTLDVADYVGKPDAGAADFAARHAGPDGKGVRVELPGGLPPLTASKADIEAAANKFLGAVKEAGKIYRAVEKAKGAGTFVTEVSMDETDVAQSPTELYFILAMIAEEKIPAQTIAPKFSGRFNKGVDYVGDVAGFAREFENDVAVAAVAAPAFGLPANLKLSVHSGSDKYSIYGPIRDACRKFDAGVHVKTAGTTWVEEIAALASVGGDGLAFAKEIYGQAYDHIDELSAPYAAVIDIDPARLPTPAEVAGWSAEKLTATLRHVPSCPDYNQNARQLVHIGYKYAVKAGQRYFDLLDKYADAVGAAVTENIYDRHLRPLFIG